MKRRLEDWPDLQQLTCIDGIIYVHQSHSSGPEMQSVRVTEAPPGNDKESVPWFGSGLYAKPVPAGYALEFGTGRLMRLQYTPNCSQEASWRRE